MRLSLELGRRRPTPEPDPFIADESITDEGATTTGQTGRHKPKPDETRYDETRYDETRYDETRNDESGTTDEAESRGRDTVNGSDQHQLGSRGAAPHERRWPISSALEGFKRSGAADFAAPATTRVFLGLMVLAMLCGPAALILRGLGQPTAARPAGESSVDVSSRDSVRAGAAAMQLVRLWLSASRADTEAVKAAMGRDPGQLHLPEQRPQPPAWVGVSDAVHTESGEWVVTVAAEGGLAGGQATYSVLVAVSSESALPVTLPARLPTPEPTRLDRDDAELLASGHPVLVTTAGFLQSLLTGTDDMSRWVAPEASIQPIGKVCSSVDLDRVEVAPTVPDTAAIATTVLATVACTSAVRTKTPIVQSLQYPLNLHQRDGRWEVVGYATDLPARGVGHTTTSTEPSPAASTTSSTSESPTGAR